MSVLRLLAGRRNVLRGMGSALVGGGIASTGAGQERQQGARALGEPAVGGYGSRSRFATEERAAVAAPNAWAAVSLTPLADMLGNITPSSLHFERHHSGVPEIDPARHMLFVHGKVVRPLRFSMGDLKRFPSVTRRYFIECSGNSSTEWRGPSQKTVQFTHGLLSTSEWTGVPFAAIAREAGIFERDGWVLAEGADAALMTRSIPIEKLLSDGLLAYGQNGEALRPEQGFPLRLVVPGYEGNIHIKWLRRLEIADAPFMTREETSKYTDLMADGRARSFTLAMDPKSVITFPSGGMRLSSPGPYMITGLAWTGKGGGRVTGVDISFDEGANWQAAALEGEGEPFSTVRFSLPWRWDGGSVVLQSRCRDDRGEIQPTRAELMRQRPSKAPNMSGYHFSAIQRWAVLADGNVINAPL